MGNLNVQRPEKNYSCAQKELYAVASVGWNNFMVHQLKFEEFSTKYANPFGPNQIAAVQSAKELPDEDSRSDEHKSLRRDLVDAAVVGIKLWSQLDLFIRDGFDADDYEDKRDAAGHNNYASATNEDWESVSSLLTAGDSFIVANSAKLTNGGMPVDFPGDFNAAKLIFDPLYIDFKESQQAAKKETDIKIVANNTLYTELMKMFTDGQKIFRDDAAERERFIYKNVFDLVSGGGSSNTGIMEGAVTFGHTSEGVPNATILFKQGGETIYSTTTDEVGDYRKTGMVVGTYDVVVVAVGYRDFSTEVEIVKGETLVVDISLIASVIVSGGVFDINTLEPKVGARVIAYEDGDPANFIEVFTNANGLYVLPIPLSSTTNITVEATAVDYLKEQQSISAVPGMDYPNRDFNLTPVV